MAVNTSGISTLGVKMGFAVETEKGVKPLSFKWLERCNNVAGIALTSENIDSSALEDLQTRNIPGRQDTGGTWEVTFNYTDEVKKQLKKMIELSRAGRLANLNTWFIVWNPDMPTSGFFVKAQPPQLLPLPEHGQNQLETIALTFTIDEYVGDGDGAEPIEWKAEWDTMSSFED